jgi:hypothetical protein
MQVADALDEIRVRNARIERGERGLKEEDAIAAVRDTVEEERLRAEREDEEAARRAFAEATARAEIPGKDAEADGHVDDGRKKSVPDSKLMAPPPPPTFERKKIVKKPLVPGLVKKAEPVRPALPPTASLGLAGYDSDSD